MATMADILATNTTQAQMSNFFIDKMGLISVKSYGATGDGVTDDTLAIQTAIDVCNSNGGGIVYLPEGEYVLTGTGNNCILLYQGVRLIGSGKATTKIIVGSVTALSELIGAYDCSGVGIANLTIDGCFQSNIQTAIAFVRVNDSLIHDVMIENLSASLGGIVVFNSSGNELVRIQMRNLLAHGITLKSDGTLPCENIKVSNCTIKGGSFAFAINNADYCQFENCIAYSDSFTNCLEGFNIDGGSYNQFVNIIAHGRGDGGFVETDLQSGYFPSHQIVNGLTTHSNSLTGISIASHDSIYNNLIVYNNGQIQYVTQDAGINIYLSSYDNILSNILAFDDQDVHTQKYGLIIISGSTNNTIKNIIGSGNVTSLIYDGNAKTTVGEIKFSAHNNGAEMSTIPNATDVKITLSDTFYNIDDCYSDGSFTPKRAGVYNIKGQVHVTSALTDQALFILSIFKNGDLYKYGQEITANGTGSLTIIVDVDVYMDGADDYVELYMYQGSGSSVTLDPLPWRTYMSAKLVN